MEVHTILIISLACGAFAHLLANDLTDDGAPLAWYRRFWEKRLIEDAAFLNKPLWKCGVCSSFWIGQLAYLYWVFVSPMPLALLTAFAVTSLSMIFAKAFEKIFE
jgi:hypothetical protein